MGEFYDILLLMNLAFGVYCLVGGITKKGGLYKNDYPEEIQEGVKASMSVLGILAGILLIASSLLEIFRIFPQNLVVYVSWGLCMVLVVAYAIHFKRRFGKYLK